MKILYKCNLNRHLSYLLAGGMPAAPQAVRS